MDVCRPALDRRQRAVQHGIQPFLGKEHAECLIIPKIPLAQIDQAYAQSKNENEQDWRYLVFGHIRSVDLKVIAINLFDSVRFFNTDPNIVLDH